jgi:hypothetical protein
LDKPGSTRGTKTKGREFGKLGELASLLMKRARESERERERETREEKVCVICVE